MKMDGIKVAEWLEAGNSPEHDMSANRREKRSVPDSEKNDKYWEKRQRNNLAAKRSRENKRFMEMTTKKKASILERENVILRREIEILKNRFGLPLNESFLSEAEIQDCKNDWKMNGSLAIKKEEDIRHETDNKNPYPVSLVRNVSPSQIKQEGNNSNDVDYSESGSSDQKEQNSKSSNVPFYGMLFASAMTAYADHSPETKTRQPSGHSSPPRNILTQPPFPYYLPYGVAKPQQPLSPTDLATKKTQFKQHVVEPHQHHTHPYARNPNNGTSNQNRDLRMKLLNLSAQVEEMKKIFAR